MDPMSLLVGAAAATVYLIVGLAAALYLAMRDDAVARLVEGRAVCAVLMWITWPPFVGAALWLVLRNRQRRRRGVRL